MFPIRWNDIFRKKDGTLGTMEDLEGGGSSLPEYDTGDAGKVLGVDAEGLLEWKDLPGGTKIYYKDILNISLNTINIGDTGLCFRHHAFSKNQLKLTGYSIIGGMIFDSDSGYKQLGGLAFGMPNNPEEWMQIVVLSQGEHGVGLRVFYIKTENTERLT